MLPYASILAVDRASSSPLYQQLATSFAAAIQRRLIPARTRVPSTRSLAAMVGLHRQTVVMAYAELKAQGWLASSPRRGMFVAEHLPLTAARPLQATEGALAYPQDPPFALARIDYPVYQPQPARTFRLQFDDGFPDVRLTPVHLLARAYRSVVRRPSARNLLRYGTGQGAEHLRNALAEDLRTTRGMPVTAEQVLITRGSQMGIHLTAALLLEPGAAVIVGQTNYCLADACFRRFGARLLRVPVDQHGLDVDAVEALCRRHRVRLLYVTPHHHHPTTVTLRSDRRLKLLELAATYGFVILEDDYDYDFHYGRSPTLPLASADATGHVVYVGSLCKSLSPSIRVGYLVAPTGFVQAAVRQRRLIDIQGDSVLEEALAELYGNGDIRRYLKKTVAEYARRRDHLGKLLVDQLAGAVQFELPAGGLAIWTRFAAEIDLRAVAARAGRRGLYLNDGSFYEADGPPLNATRLGFASLNAAEQEEAVELLRQAL